MYSAPEPKLWKAQQLIALVLPKIEGLVPSTYVRGPQLLSFLEKFDRKQEEKILERISKMKPGKVLLPRNSGVRGEQTRRNLDQF
ncbi:hypothetical protein STEG23_000024 [Scotinomys teguina]